MFNIIIDLGCSSTAKIQLCITRKILFFHSLKALGLMYSNWFTRLPNVAAIVLSK